MRARLLTLATPKFFLALLLGCYFFFGVSHIGQFLTADEGKWIYERIPQYWEAILSANAKKTFINDKPGVSLALVSAAGTFLYPDSEKHCKEGKDKIFVCDTAYSEKLFFSFRLPILILNGLMLVFFFWLIGKLANPWIGLWSTTLIGLSPILLGISQIVNPDALLWSFTAGSLFSFCAYLKFEEKKYALFAALFLGLALLSKYVALILLPFYFGSILLRFLLTTDGELLHPRRSLIRDLIALAGIAAGSLVVVCFFLPAFVFYPGLVGEFLISIENKAALFSMAGAAAGAVIADTFLWRNRGLFWLRRLSQRHLSFFAVIPIFFIGFLVAVVAARYLFPEWDLITKIPFDMKNLDSTQAYRAPLNFFESYFLEWNPVVFSLTPVVLLGLFFLGARMLWTEKDEYFFAPYVLPIFMVFYVVVLILTDVLATIRYSVILYPLMAVLAAIGFWSLAKRLPFGRWNNLILTGFIFAASLASLTDVKPYYFNYTNALLPKEALLTDAWGYGGYEAAQYLNSLPDTKNLTVWSDYYGVCEFFVGRCLTAYSFNKETIKPDYYVLTRRGGIRYTNPRRFKWERESGLTAYHYYDDPEPVWQLIIDGHPGNFVKVVKVAR